MCHYNEVEWETFNEHVYAADSESEEETGSDGTADDVSVEEAPDSAERHDSARTERLSTASTD